MSLVCDLVWLSFRLLTCDHASTLDISSILVSTLDDGRIK